MNSPRFVEHGDWQHFPLVASCAREIAPSRGRSTASTLSPSLVIKACLRGHSRHAWPAKHARLRARHKGRHAPGRIEPACKSALLLGRGQHRGQHRVRASAHV